MRRESAATLRVQRLDAAECHDIIRREVRGRKKGKLHAAVYDWRALVDQGLEAAPANDAKEEELEERTQTEVDSRTPSPDVAGPDD